MNKYKYIYLGLLVGGICIALLADREEKFGADTIKESTMVDIGWVEPKTDAEWIKDTEKENLDIRPYDVLAEMKATHEDKLAKIIEEKSIFAECPECVRYEIRQQLEAIEKQGEALDADIDTLVEQQFMEEKAQFEYDVLTLDRSIQRMTKELELRDSGAVVEVSVDSKSKLTEELQTDKKGNTIRYVIE